MKASAGIATRIAGQAPAIAVAVVIVALALAGGGSGGVALGIATILIWLAVIAAALGPGSRRTLTRSLALAAAALAVLAVLAATSLGWSINRGAGFEDVVRYGAYLGAFVLAGLLLGPGSGRVALRGIGAGLVIVALLALGSRLLGIGSGDDALVATMPSSAGRLSYPIGYWNALGAIAAMAVPVLVWLASDSRRRPSIALALAGIPPVLLAAYMTSSRGALIAAAIGAAVVIAAADSRSRALAALAVGALASAPAIAAATLATGILDDPGTTPGRPELVVCATLLAGIVGAAVIGPAAVERIGRVVVPGLRMRHAFAAAVVALVAVIVLVGPVEIVGDFAATDGREATAGGNQLSVSGSGRAQFWSAALDAFAAEPLRGIGAGSFGLYWNRHGSLETPVQNVHSEPLELLAELGLVGLAAFLAFFATVAIAGIGRARPPGGAAAGACLGLLATGLVGILIDWTWEIPSVAVPMLMAAALLTSRALDGADARASAATSSRQGFSVPAPALAVVVAAFALAAIWAGGVLAVADDRLAASGEAFADGDLAAAAAAARSAAVVEPWAAEPWLRLATIEQAAGNLEAARSAARRAIELAPDDVRSWLLASTIAGELGDSKVLGAYAIRALRLAPLVIPRVLSERRLVGPSS